MPAPASSPQSQPSPAKGVGAIRDGGGDSPRKGGFIVRQAEPLNLEMPFGALDSFVTPTAEFFVRCHFAVPTLDPGSWRLAVRGLVARPLELSLAELRAMPATRITAVLECAGNGRVFLSPKVDGAQWERGAVGNAQWTGVRLKHVLERAGVKPDATEVVLTGADTGKVDNTPHPGEKIRFARSLPLAKAADDVLLAWQMNGEDLTTPHGFPLRAIVPGWYGMASVKWLQEVLVTARPFQGYYQTVEYSFWDRSQGEPSLVAITELQVKAQIARPGPLEAVPAGRGYLVHGAAWSGNSEIARVEVSADCGASWHPAKLAETSDACAWRLWEWEWAVPARPGQATLMARAFDARGRTQPSRRDLDRGSYLINEVVGIDVCIV